MEDRYRYYTSDESLERKGYWVRLKKNAGRPRPMGKIDARGTKLQNRILVFLVPGRSLRLKLHRYYCMSPGGRGGWHNGWLCHSYYTCLVKLCAHWMLSFSRQFHVELVSTFSGLPAQLGRNASGASATCVVIHKIRLVVCCKSK